jgi:preprotein translocase subunit SecD
MLNFPRWKVWSISLLLLLGVVLSVPSFLPSNIASRIPVLHAIHVNLGLDLAGGSQLLLEAETQDVARQRAENMEDVLRGEFRRAGINVSQMGTSNGEVRFLVDNPAQFDAATTIARNNVGQASRFGGAAWTVSVADGRQVTMSQTDAGVNEGIRQAMENARDVIDRRINALGTLEPTIIQQGANRILVQVPGMQDPEALKRLIGRTARLEFKLVEVDAAACNAPRRPGIQYLPSDELPNGQCMGVQSRAMINGEQIADANQNYDDQNRVAVQVRFNVQGAQRFAQVTQANVHRRFAIILDNRIISAPSINEPILGGTASISGSFTVESANALAISLRSGRLSVDLHVVEERTVGPDLGADSIRAGIIACIVATLAVLVFMFLSYGRFGLYADFAVLINLFVIVGVMGLFNGTLTLPGIAGFVLTVGTAVDANVLIYERIREERRKGRTVIMAVENGYKEASRTIFEANVTHAIAALIMLLLGTGPVKGFAIVLLIGIATSVFTAVTFTRMLVARWIRAKRPSDIHI